jgi:hypothetical protein
MLIFSAFATQNEPWWHDAQLEWKLFTGLPSISTPYQWYWDIQERSDNENPKFFAQSIGAASNDKFFVADSSVLPSFVEASTNLPFGSAFSTAMARLNNPFNEFFVGTSLGLWRFNENENQFVCEWYWNWDPTYQIVSLGNSIYGRVSSWGSQSGYHIWGAGGLHTYEPFGGTSEIWGDPISGNHGIGSRNVRIISPGQSIIVKDYGTEGGLYSLDGGLTFKSPVGIRSDGLPLYVYNFYGYSGTNIIVENMSYGESTLFIGPLGGIMYPLSCPTNERMTTLFYSPTTRLLIAGDVNSSGLYYAVLPGPDEVLGPKLNLQEAFIISWESKYEITNLESTTDLASGNWTTVTAPQNVISNKIQVAVPKTQQMFFRLTSP